MAAAALTFAYISRWLLLFLGPPDAEAAAAATFLVAPVAVLAMSVLGSLFVAPFARLAAVGSRGLVRAEERLGPRRIYEGAARPLAGLGREVRDLRTSIADVLVPAGVLIALAFAATPTAGAYTLGRVTGVDMLVLALLGQHQRADQQRRAKSPVIVTRSGPHSSAVLNHLLVGWGLSAQQLA